MCVVDVVGGGHVDGVDIALAAVLWHHFLELRNGFLERSSQLGSLFRIQKAEHTEEVTLHTRGNLQLSEKDEERRGRKTNRDGERRVRGNGGRGKERGRKHKERHNQLRNGEEAKHTKEIALSRKGIFNWERESKRGRRNRDEGKQEEREREEKQNRG